MLQNNKQKIAQIIEKKYDKNTQFLDLNHNKQNWCEVLTQRNWSMLKSVKLYDCRITDDKIREFFDLTWPHMIFLSLCNNQLGRGSMKLMVNCFLVNLKQLNLSINLIGNIGVKFLTKANLPNLVKIWLDYCNIGSQGMKHLIKGIWPNLKQFHLGKYQFKNDNKLQLSGWQILDQFQFRKVQKFAIQQVQSICWMKCIIMQAFEYQINKNGFKIINEELKQLLLKILSSRNIQLKQ